MNNLINPLSVALGVWLTASSVVAQTPTLKACSLPIVVRATLLADENPEWSTAMIYHRDRASSKSYTINAGSNQLSPGVVIREIHKLSVIVDNRGQLERCTGEAHQFTAPSHTGPRAKDEPTEIALGAVPSRLNDIFESLGDAEKAGVSGIAGAARPGVKAAWTDKFSVPGISGGPSGERAFQVGRLQKDSIYYQLGIRNFDVVKSINGHGFASPAHAMSLLEKVGGATSLTIQVQRRGKTVNIDVNLH